MKRLFHLVKVCQHEPMWKIPYYQVNMSYYFCFDKIMLLFTYHSRALICPKWNSKAHRLVDRQIWEQHIPVQISSVFERLPRLRFSCIYNLKCLRPFKFGSNFFGVHHPKKSLTPIFAEIFFVSDPIRVNPQFHENREKEKKD